MMRIGRSLMTLVVLALFPAFPTAGEAPDPISQELEAVLIAHFAAGDRGDVSGALAEIHTQSPLYLGTKQSIEALVANFRLQSRVLDFTFISVSGEYALARAKQELRKVSGPAFRDNVMDSVYIFRREGGRWKLWQQAVLELRYIEPAPSSPR